MALTKEQSTAMAEKIVNNLEAFTVNRKDKMNLSVEQHVKLMREKRESMARRKAILNEDLGNGLSVNNRGYGEGRKMGD